MTDNTNLDVLAESAQFNYLLGDYPVALELAERLWQLSLGNEQHPDQLHGKAAVCLVRGLVNIETGLLGDTLGHLRLGLSMLDSKDDPGLRAKLYSAIGFAFYFDNKMGPAHFYCRKAVDLCEEWNLKAELIFCLNTTFNVLLGLKNIQGAILLAERAIRLAREYALPHHLAPACINRAIALLNHGEPDAAEGSILEGLQLYQQLNAHNMETYSRGILAFCRLLQGNLQEAHQIQTNVLREISNTGYFTRKVVYLHTLAEIEIRLGHLDKSLEALNEANQIAQKNSNQLILASIHKSYAILYEKMGNYEQALDHHKIAMRYEQIQSAQYFAQQNYVVSDRSATFGPLVAGFNKNKIPSLFINPVEFISLGNQYVTEHTDSVDQVHLIDLSFSLPLDPITLLPIDVTTDILELVVRCFTENLRITDLVSWYSNTRFHILLLDAGIKDATQISENLVRWLEGQTMKLESIIDSKTITAHVSTFGSKDSSFSHFINRALYEATV